MQFEVTCMCGWTCRGSEDDVIAQVQEHGRSTHGIETTADEVRATWHPVEPGATGG